MLGVDDDGPDALLRVHVEIRGSRPGCPGCGGGVRVKDRPTVVLVDLSCFGRPTCLVWRKYRWVCVDSSCLTVSWTEQDPRIASPCLALTDRAGRWVTYQVGKCGRTVNEVAQELGCDWHTVNDAVIAYGTAFVEDENRIGDVTALGLDETLFCRIGRWRHQAWSTQIVDVRAGRLLGVVPGEGDSTGATVWLQAQP